ncbi:hypothetical protein K2Y11_09625 [bacterium]|nr:hypothetical protein [bacterium]
MMLSSLFTEHPYPDELLNLYNPAYVASIVYLGGRAFRSKTKRNIPIYFPYIIFPLISIDSCRCRLPYKTGKLSDWARQNGDVLFDFPERVLALRPFVTSGLIYLQSHSLLRIDNNAMTLNIVSRKSLTRSLSSIILSSEDVRDELERAPAAGRLLSAEGEVSSVLAIFGLKP